jgi:hypothetical protein
MFILQIELTFGGLSLDDVVNGIDGDRKYGYVK